MIIINKNAKEYLEIGGRSTGQFPEDQSMLRFGQET